MRLKLGQKIIDKFRNKNNKEREELKHFDNTNFPIRLTDYERNFFLDNIKNSESYLEYGSGGSTFLALLNTNAKTITSVESDNNWLVYLRNWGIISENENNRLKFISVNIGKTGDWGCPVEPYEKNLFPNYSLAPFKNNEKYDVVFVDGRFRVACALQAILNSSLNTKILMHDFNNRNCYHVILDYLNIVDTADTMALFKIKENYDKEKLINLYEEYKYDFN